MIIIVITYLIIFFFISCHLEDYVIFNITIDILANKSIQLYPYYTIQGIFHFLIFYEEKAPFNIMIGATVLFISHNVIRYVQFHPQYHRKYPDRSYFHYRIPVLLLLLFLVWQPITDMHAGYQDHSAF